MKSKRKLSLLQELKQNGKVSIKEYSERFDVSLPVIRQDIDELSKLFPDIKRVYGQAFWMGSKLKLDAFRTKVKKNFQEKRRVAQYMTSQVKDNSNVVIFPGTIPYLCSEEIIDMEKQGLNIFSCSLPAIVALSSYPFVRTICQGGLLDQVHLFFHRHRESNGKEECSENLLRRTLSASGLPSNGKDILFDTALATTQSIDLANAALKDSITSAFRKKKFILSHTRNIIIGITHKRLNNDRGSEAGYRPLKGYYTDSRSDLTIVIDDSIPDQKLKRTKKKLRNQESKFCDLVIAGKSGKTGKGIQLNA